MEKILNLTQHKATNGQTNVGVFEPTNEDKKKIKNLLTFKTFFDCDRDIMKKRAALLSFIAQRYQTNLIMIGGAPFFMGYLELALLGYGLTPIYAFSKRVILEDKDGKKTSIFKHEGFIKVTKYD